MKPIFLRIIPLIMTVSLMACVSEQNSSSQYDLSYVPPTQYQSYNCNQIQAEIQRVLAKIEQAQQIDGSNQILGAVVTAYAISRGYGLYGDEVSSEQMRYRNQLDVLEQTSIQKECK